MTAEEERLLGEVKQEFKVFDEGTKLEVTPLITHKVEFEKKTVQECRTNSVKSVSMVPKNTEKRQ